MASRDPFNNLEVAPDTLVLLDVGGVVVRTAWELLGDHVAVTAGILPLLGPFSLGVDTDWIRWQAGDLTEQNYWISWADRLRGSEAIDKDMRAGDDPVRALYQQTRSIERDCVADFLEDCSERGHGVALVSNGVRRRVGMDRVAQLRSRHPATSLIDAEAAGARKPSSQFFAFVEQATGVPRGRWLFIDDNQSYAQEASRLGIPAVWYRISGSIESVDVELVFV